MNSYDDPVDRDLLFPPMRRLRHNSLIAAAALILTCSGAAQERPDSTMYPADGEGVGQDTDPTKPVAFSLRDEFAVLGEETSLNFFILRVDRLVLEGLAPPGPARGVLTRIDLPVVTLSNPSTTETGLGDIYLQALVAPRIAGPFVVAAGSGLQVPTATSSAFGTGKWILSPAIVPIWLLPREGYAYIKIQDWFSFAGHSDRSAVHYFMVTGLFLRRFAKQWWTLLDAESHTDWLDDGKTWYKVGAQIGWMPTHRVGLWLKGEIPIGPHRPSNWIIKGSVFITRF